MNRLASINIRTTETVLCLPSCPEDSRDGQAPNRPLDANYDYCFWCVRFKTLMILLPIWYFTMIRRALQTFSIRQATLLLPHRLTKSSESSGLSLKNPGNTGEAGPALWPKIYTCQDLKDVQTVFNELQKSSRRPTGYFGKMAGILEQQTSTGADRQDSPNIGILLASDK